MPRISQQLHPHREPVPTRLAATVLLLRDAEGDGALEVLMTRRSPNASFAPGAYVFPGGGIDALDAHGQDIHGEAFPTLDLDVRMAIVDEFKQSSAPFIRAVTSITVQCYYRDARVMESLGMEARPPFPKGYEGLRGMR